MLKTWRTARVDRPTALPLAFTTLGARGEFATLAGGEHVPAAAAVGWTPGRGSSGG